MLLSDDDFCKIVTILLSDREYYFFNYLVYSVLNNLIYFCPPKLFYSDIIIISI